MLYKGIPHPCKPQSGEVLSIAGCEVGDPMVPQGGGQPYIKNPSIGKAILSRLTPDHFWYRFTECHIHYAPMWIGTKRLDSQYARRFASLPAQRDHPPVGHEQAAIAMCQRLAFPARLQAYTPARAGLAPPWIFPGAPPDDVPLDINDPASVFWRNDLLADSSNATAASRLTVGKLSRNSSRESPSSIESPPLSQ